MYALHSLYSTWLHSTQSCTGPKTATESTMYKLQYKCKNKNAFIELIYLRLKWVTHNNIIEEKTNIETLNEWKYSSVSISQFSSCYNSPLRQLQACATTGNISFALKYLANNKPSKTVLKARFNNFRRRMLHNNVSKKFSKAAWSIEQPFERVQKRNYN